MSDAATLRLAHHHPGRIRVRADVWAQSTEGLERLQPLRARAGVISLTHNPATGSVVVEYDPARTDSTVLLDELCELGGFDGVVDEAEDKGSRREPEQVVIALVKTLNGVAREISNDSADLKVLAPAALASAAVVSFVFHDKIRRMPRWDNLLYWSYSVFVDWHRQQIHAAPRGPLPE